MSASEEHDLSRQPTFWAKLAASSFAIVLVTLALAVALQSYDNVRYANATLPHVVDACLRLAFDIAVWHAISCTLYLAAKGLLLGLAMAALLGSLLSLYPVSHSFVMPFANALRAIPLTLLTPFIVALPVIFPYPPWVQNDGPSKDPAYLIALGSFLYFLIGIVQGLSRREPEREWVMRRVLGCSRWRYFRRVLVFEALPHLLTTTRLALLFALVLAIVLEQLLQFPGIGKMIAQKLADSGPNNDLEAEALSLLAMVATIGVAIDATYTALGRRIAIWAPL